MSTFETMTRRKLLKAAGAVASGAALPAASIKRAGAAEQITVADVGGAPAAALRTAFYDPFEKQTGIRVENIAHESDPVTQFKLVVDANTLAAGLVLTLFMGALGGLVPALTAMRLRPLESLK